MNKIVKLITALLLIAALLCGCGGEKAPVLELDAEDLALLEAFGDDLIVVAPADFATGVAGLSEATVGFPYQFTGTFHAAAEGAENPTLSDAANTASLELTLLETELVEGAQYTITGILAAAEHDGHSHISLDVLTVESYTAE